MWPDPDAERQPAEDLWLSDDSQTQALDHQESIWGVYAQAETATPTVLTDAGAGTALETTSASTATPGSAATSTDAAATDSAGLAGLGLGALGLSGAVGLGLVALAAGSSKSAEPITTTPTEPTNAAPSALALTGALKGSGKNEIAENTPTTSRTKVADIAITDDGLGTNTLSLSGADKDRFEIVGNALYLKAGTVLDYETKRSYAVTVQVQDSTIAGSPARSQNFELSVTDANEAAVNAVPQAKSLYRDSAVAIAGLSVADADAGASAATYSVTLSVAHGTLQVAGSPGVVQSGDGTDSFKTLTGTLADINAALAAPGAVTYRGHLAYVGADTLQMRTEQVGSPAQSDSDSVAITVNNFVIDSATAYDMWQEAETAWVEQTTTGSTSHNVEFLNQISGIITSTRDATSADGSVNQADASKRLTQYIHQVTGTDIVSDVEFDAGFVITGKATAGAQATIQWRLDKDRTTGLDGEGAQVLSLGANDVNNDGTTDVTAQYNNATGEWSLAFAAGSAALLQATHNTWGSGVHQLVVDTDGNGSRTGSGATAEASRLFLVASGTASSADTGLGSQNYSVQDKITSDVFVYYHGDPDGAGIGLWTALDNGDSASNPRTVITNKDSNTIYSSDWDYYNTPAANTNAATTPATASNTALHMVTDIAAQTWEFHMGTNSNWETWDAANAQATDHTLWGSNSSRQASLAEAIALYAANFGGDGSTRTPNTVGAVQPMSNAGSTNAYAAVEDNSPGGWDTDMWSAAPTPSGHALLNLYLGYVYDYPNALFNYVSAVL